MRISHRLYLTVTPAILGVFLLAGLAYWGQYARTAPVMVVVLGAVAVVASLVMTWSNARYVARRIERLAGTAASTSAPIAPPDTGITPISADTSEPPDEIDQIERAVDRLSNAIELAETSRLSRDQQYERRVHDYALLLASIADVSAKRLEEVRLPLHILLENHFGDLNENQEEMLAAARTAAEAADADMLSLRQIAAIDLGEKPMRHDRMKPAEIIDALRALLLATAGDAGVTLEFDIEPVLPAIHGDRVRLQEAFATLLKECIRAARRDARIRVSVARAGHLIRFMVRGAGAITPTVRWAAGIRVMQAHSGTVERLPDGLSIELPSDTASRVLPM